jgi:hypothetical protein
MSADMQVTSTPTPHFLSQPVEMVAKIASFLSASDICALRLTCKTMHDLLEDFFLHKFFRSKQFLMHGYSLQALVDMSAHPTISPAMKHVFLGTHRLYVPNRNVPQTRTFTSAQIHHIHGYLAIQTYLQHTAAELAMLIKAFLGLKNLETFSIRDFDKSDEY